MRLTELVQDHSGHVLTGEQLFEHLRQFGDEVRIGPNLVDLHHVGRVKNVDLQTLNELFLQMQPAHLQKLQGERLNGEQRSVARATLIRARLSSN